jgi:hypothetical protein
VCDKNEGQRIRGLCKAISVVVPNWELSFVFHCPSIDEFLSIRHNIVSLMAINIHSVLHFSVSPFHFCKPPLCRRLRNGGLVNPQPCKQGLQPLTCDDLTQVLSLDKAVLRSLRQCRLDFLQDIFVPKDCLAAIAIGMEGKLPFLDKIKNPLSDAACTTRSMPLCLRNNN